MGKKRVKKATSAKKAMRAKRPAAAKKAAKKSKKKITARVKPTIKPARAPAMLHSPEVGAHVGQHQAIDERLRLYPKATTQEIVAMFELDGVKVSPAVVEQVRRGGRRS